MKKCLSITLILAMLLSWTGALTFGAVAAESASRTAAYAATPPTMDGVEDDIWSTTKEMTYERTWESGGIPTHQKATVKMLWDADNLYILAKMEYSGNVDSKNMEFRVCENTSYDGAWENSREKGGHGMTIYEDGTDGVPWGVPSMIAWKTASYEFLANTDGSGYVAELQIKRVYLEAFTEGTDIRFAACTPDRDKLNTGKLDNGVPFFKSGGDVISKPTSCDTVRLVRAAEHSQRTAAYAATPPTMDGVEDDIWSTTKEMTYERTWESGGIPTHQKATVKMLWDADNLYILAKMEYSGNVDSKNMEFRVCENTSYDGAWENSREKGGHGMTIYEDGTDGVPWGVPSMIAWKTASYEFLANTDGSGYVAELQIKRVYLEAFTEGTDIRFAACTPDRDKLNTGKLDNGVPFFKSKSDVISKPTSCDTVRLVANPGLPQTQKKTVVLRGLQTMTGIAGGTDVRFVAELAGLDYDAAGFELEIAYNGMTATKDYRTGKAFSSILANGETVKPTADGNYLIAVALTGIPDGATVQFTVRTYTLVGEEKTYGTAGSVALDPSNG